MSKEKLRKDEEGWEPSTADPVRRKRDRWTSANLGNLRRVDTTTNRKLPRPDVRASMSWSLTRTSRRASKRRNDLAPELKFSFRARS